MVVTSGKVVDGKIVIEGEPLPDGTIVTVLARGSEEEFALTPEQEQFLLESAEQCRRGDSVPAEEVLARIAPR